MITSDLPCSLGLPPIDQIGLVVRDLEEALVRYAPVFGPFVVFDNGPFDAVYRGQPARIQLSVAFGRSGDLEIELVQWRAGDSPHREFIERHGEGVQHVRFRVDSMDAWVEKCRPLGYEPVWSGSYPAVGDYAGLSWCYLERPGDPLMIEFVVFQ